MVSVLKRKGEVSTFFVYASSILIIGFISFIVIKFVVGFTHDTQQAELNKFYDELGKQIDKVKVSYGSLFTKSIRIGGKATSVCIISNYSKCPAKYYDKLSGLESSGANVVIFNKDLVLSSKKVSTFIIKDGCQCKEIKRSRLLDITFENDRNKVYLYFN